MANLIRLPDIKGGTPDSRIDRLQNYIYQLVEQLNYMLTGDGDARKVKKESGAVSADLASLPNVPDSVSDAAGCVRFSGGGRTFYVLVDTNGSLYVGVQAGGSITWEEK